MDHLQMRLQLQVIRLQRLLPPATNTACQQVAWRIQWRLPALLTSVEWEANLLREIGRELDSQPIQGPIIAAVLMTVAAVIVLIGNLIAKAKEDEAAGKEKELEAMKEKLKR